MHVSTGKLNKEIFVKQNYEMQTENASKIALIKCLGPTIRKVMGEGRKFSASTNFFWLPTCVEYFFARYWYIFLSTNLFFFWFSLHECPPPPSLF